MGLFGVGLAFTWGEVPPEVLLAEAFAAAILAAFVAGAAVLVPSRAGLLAGFPAAFVLAAAVQGRWPLGGLPGVGVAIGQVDGPLAVTARWGGELAIVLMAAVVAGALGWWWRRPQSWRAAVGALGLAACLVVAGTTSGDGHPIDRLQVAAVQGGGERGVDAVPYDVFYDLQVRAAEAAPRRMDMVVLSEGVAHVQRPLATTAEGRGLARLARELDTTLVAGVVSRVDARSFRNTAVAWTPSGRVADEYDKRHGVPFGEYIPARSFLDRFVDLSLTPRDIRTGTEPGVLRTPAGDVGVAISFEVFFPRLVRDSVRAGAEVIVVPSNASSFPTDLAAALELAASRLRALETGRWLVQVTPTGHTAIIGPDGRLVAHTGIGTRPLVVVEQVERRAGATPFVRFGEWPVIGLAVAALLAGWWRERNPWQWGRTRRHSVTRGRTT